MHCCNNIAAEIITKKHKNIQYKIDSIKYVAINKKFYTRTYVDCKVI